jgi:hypothetical protein
LLLPVTFTQSVSALQLLLQLVAPHR